MSMRVRGVAEGGDGIIKVASRSHETLAAVLTFDTAIRSAQVRAAAVLRHGSTKSGWWVLTQRFTGTELAHPTPGLQAEVAAELGRLHEWQPLPAWFDAAADIRVDSPGNVDLMFEMLRQHDEVAGWVASNRYADAVAGQVAVALHSDAGSGHNVIATTDGHLVGFIDPGAHRVGPAAHDLAYAAVNDISLGLDPDGLFTAYPHQFDMDLVGELMVCLAPRIRVGITDDARASGRRDLLDRWIASHPVTTS